MEQTFVIGDIHGAWKALIQCFERSSFDGDRDMLISLGDACDGWPQVYQAVDELMKVKNLVYILGNHDQWALTWALKGSMPMVWLMQGGQATIDSYRGQMPDNHRKFFSSARLHYLSDDRLFVHGGIDPARPLNEQDTDTLIWDRSLVEQACAMRDKTKKVSITGYREVYLGHTPTLNFNSSVPLSFCECWLMDTGAGYHGRLTMMDIGTKEYFQSDPVPQLYSGYSGRF